MSTLESGRASVRSLLLQRKRFVRNLLRLYIKGRRASKWILFKYLGAQRRAAPFVPARIGAMVPAGCINPRHHPSLDQHKRLNRKNNVNPIIQRVIYIVLFLALALEHFDSIDWKMIQIRSIISCSVIAQPPKRVIAAGPESVCGVVPAASRNTKQLSLFAATKLGPSDRRSPGAVLMWVINQYLDDPWQMKLQQRCAHSPISADVKSTRMRSAIASHHSNFQR